MGLNPKQRMAVFEKLKAAGRLKPSIHLGSSAGQPRPMSPLKQMGGGLPLVPQAPNPMKPQVVPGSPQANPNEVNQNLIGPGRKMRFKKLKGMTGM